MNNDNDNGQIDKKTEILINSLMWLYTRENKKLIAYDSETIHKAIDELNTLSNERNEARRMYCSENSLLHGTSAENVAKCMGWDCYKKEETL